MVRTFTKKSWNFIHQYLLDGRGSSGVPLKISMRAVKEAYGRGQRMAEDIVRGKEL